MTYVFHVGGDDPRYGEAVVAFRQERWSDTIRRSAEVLAAHPEHTAAQNLFASALHMLRNERDDDARLKLLSVMCVDVGGSSRLTTVLGPERWRRHLLAIQSVVAPPSPASRGTSTTTRATPCSARSRSLVRTKTMPAAPCSAAWISCRSPPRSPGSSPRNVRGAGSDDRFTVRVGIDTGHVVVGPRGTMPSVNAADLVGDAVNFAARLQHHAGRSGVAISERTLEFVRGFFRTEPEGPLHLRSFEPQVIHHVFGSTAAEDRLQATAHRTPMVGRTAEIERLTEAWSEVGAGGRRTVMLRGEAGVGKSRLAEVVVDLVRTASRPVIELRCSSLMRASAFGPIGALFIVSSPSITPSARSRLMWSNVDCEMRPAPPSPIGCQRSSPGWSASTQLTTCCPTSCGRCRSGR